MVDSKVAKVKPSGIVESGFRVSQTQVQIPAFSLAGCLTLGKALPFPGPQEARSLRIEIIFPALQNCLKVEQSIWCLEAPRTVPGAPRELST